MARKYFEEVQALREKTGIWIVMVVVSILFFTGILLKWNTAQENDSVEKMDLTTLTFLVVGATVAIVVMFMLLLSSKLEIYVDDEGIHYRFPPKKGKWTVIKKEEIESYNIAKKHLLARGKKAGYHHNIFNHTVSMFISGKTYLQVKTKSKRYLIGTQNAETFEQALKRVMSNE